MNALVFLLVIALYVIVCTIPWRMAKRRGRNGLLWFIISLCIGFWWSIIILWIVGNK